MAPFRTGQPDQAGPLPQRPSQHLRLRRRTRVARPALELAPILCAAPALGSGHRFPLAQLGAGGERLVEAVAP
jgi:hypothetical protein